MTPSRSSAPSAACASPPGARSTPTDRGTTGETRRPAPTSSKSSGSAPDVAWPSTPRTISSIASELTAPRMPSRARRRTSRTRRHRPPTMNRLTECGCNRRNILSGHRAIQRRGRSLSSMPGHRCSIRRRGPSGYRSIEMPIERRNRGRRRMELSWSRSAYPSRR